VGKETPWKQKESTGPRKRPGATKNAGTRMTIHKARPAKLPGRGLRLKGGSGGCKKIVGHRAVDVIRGRITRGAKN